MEIIFLVFGGVAGGFLVGFLVGRRASPASPDLFGKEEDVDDSRLVW